MLLSLFCTHWPFCFSVHSFMKNSLESTYIFSYRRPVRSVVSADPTDTLLLPKLEKKEEEERKMFLSQSIGYTEEWAGRDLLKITVFLKFVPLPHKLYSPVDEKPLNDAIKLGILCNLA